MIVVLRVCEEIVTIYRVLCRVWCKECGCRLYLSPYSRSSWSQSPLTVPASPASCQSNTQTSECHQNTVTGLVFYCISVFFLYHNFLYYQRQDLSMFSMLQVQVWLSAKKLIMCVWWVRNVRNIQTMQTLQTIGACVSSDQTPGQFRNLKQEY